MKWKRRSFSCEKEENRFIHISLNPYKLREWQIEERRESFSKMGKGWDFEKYHF
jgi:hypothetical protein